VMKVGSFRDFSFARVVRSGERRGGDGGVA